MASEHPPDAADDDQDDDTEKPLGRDDRVSLWPLSFEQVVKAMLNTPPAEDGK